MAVSGLESSCSNGESISVVFNDESEAAAAVKTTDDIEANINIAASNQTMVREFVEEDDKRDVK